MAWPLRLSCHAGGRDKPAGQAFAPFTRPRRPREATAAPATVYALADLDPADGLAGALRGGPDSVHLVRPDGHLAAVLPRFERDALARRTPRLRPSR
jgi:hypothetical protein